MLRFALFALLATVSVACGGPRPEAPEAQSSAVVQASFYVSPQGSDSNSGSFSSPFATVDRARQAVRAVNASMSGDINVYLRGGTYALAQPLSFAAADSGTNGHTVFYQAYPGETPILSGGRAITGWTLWDSAKNIWRAPASGLQTRQLYVNGVRAVRARSTGGLPPGTTKTSSGYTYSGGFAQWGNVGDVELVFTGQPAGSSNWQDHRCDLQAETSTTLTVKQPCFKNLYPPGDTHFPSYVENAYALLDQPGEWYLDRAAGAVFYIPRAGETMTLVNVVAPTLETLVTGTALSNVQFSGLTFAYATWLRPNGNDGFVDLQADVILVGDPSTQLTLPANVAFHGARSVSFVGDVFAHLGAAGLALDSGSQTCRVWSNQFYDISASALRIGDVTNPTATGSAQDTFTSVLDNYIHDVAVEFRGSVGVLAGYVAGLSVAHNELANLPYTGISLGWGWGTASYAHKNLISANHIHDLMQVLADGGGVYTLSPQGTTLSDRSTVAGNYIHSATNVFGGLYHDEGSSWFDTHDNVLSAVNTWLLINNAGDSTKINNNNLSIHDNFADLTRCLDNLSGGQCTNNATQHITYSNNQSGLSSWPAGALSTIAAAGLEPGAWSLFAGAQGRNLAAGRSAIASTVYSSAFGSAMANDGSLGSGWSPDASVAAHWWQVDLGQPLPLSEIEVVTRQDLDQPVTRQNFAIWASNSADMSGHVVLATQGATPLPYRATFRSAIGDTNAYRYVRITKTVAEYFFLGEVRVYGTELNLAANRPAGASSVFSASFGPAMANDTNTGSGWSPTGATQVPWWEVDLGGAFSLSQIQVVTRRDLDQPVTRQNFAVWASNNADMSLGHVVLGQQTTPPLPFQATWTLAVGDTTPYRYVALVKTAAEYFFLGDVRVYGRDPNVAKGKPAVASSVWGTGFEAAKANDGDINTGWAAASGPPSFWLVDLGQPYTLSQIQLATRQDLDQPTTRQGFSVWLSNNADMSLGHVVAARQGAVPLPHQGSFITRITDPTPYRYVAITDTTFLADVAVYGH